MKVLVVVTIVLATVNARTMPIPVKHKPVLPIVPIIRPSGSLGPRPVIHVPVVPPASSGTNYSSSTPFSFISETTTPTEKPTIASEPTVKPEGTTKRSAEKTSPAIVIAKHTKKPNSLQAYASCGPSSCLEIKLSSDSKAPSGVYTIYPREWFNVDPFDVYCDMETDGGGWTVIQRRGAYTEQENFNRNWTDYRHGFGNKYEDHWLGLETILLLTLQDQVSLRVDLQDVNGRRVHGIYRSFQLGHRDEKYAIFCSDFKGSAGDPLWFGTPFTTKDDSSVKPECVKKLRGGWWLNDNCPPGERMNNLNGDYRATMNWKTWDAELEWTELKIRPCYFPKCANGGSHYYYA